MPLILGALALLGVGGLVFKNVTDDLEDTVNATTPNLVTLAVVGVGAVVVLKQLKII